jgi:hypothetical protein
MACSRENFTFYLYLTITYRTIYAYTGESKFLFFSFPVGLNIPTTDKNVPRVVTCDRFPAEYTKNQFFTSQIRNILVHYLLLQTSNAYSILIKHESFDFYTLNKFLISGMC